MALVMQLRQPTLQLNITQLLGFFVLHKSELTSTVVKKMGRHFGMGKKLFISQTIMILFQDLIKKRTLLVHIGKVVAIIGIFL